MANLITEKQKKSVRADYLVRLSSLALVVPISLLGIFLLAYIVPYYFSVSEKDQKVAEQFNSVINVENKENVGESANRVVGQTLEEMKAVELYAQGGLIPSHYINKIIENKNSDISITKLSLIDAKNNQGQFMVSGLAKSREGLVNFIATLKSKAGFASVESPVSNFAKDQNIAFTINIKTAI